MNLIRNMCSEITFLKLLPYSQGAMNLMQGKRPIKVAHT